MVDDKEDLLTKEIQSWDSFKYTLREEIRLIWPNVKGMSRGKTIKKAK